MLRELLQIKEDASIISIVGAGGKTSLMHMFARESNQNGLKTAMMTTTHIHRPEEIDIMVWDNGREDSLEEIWKNNKIVCAGTYAPSQETKFLPPSDVDYTLLRKKADCIYIEADGANCLPVKYPAIWEPVIGFRSDDVVLIAGLSALGKPIDEICHRPHLIREELNISANLLGPTELGLILSAGYGRYRPSILLNQADTPELMAKGEEVAAFLRDVGMKRVTVSSLHGLNHGPAYHDDRR